MHIKKDEFLKSIRFSQTVLIQDDLMFFIKLGKEDELIVKDLSIKDISFSKNKIFFASKEIKKDIENIDKKELKISNDEDNLYIENIKIELLNTVVKYGK